MEDGYTNNPYYTIACVCSSHSPNQPCPYRKGILGQAEVPVYSAQRKELSPQKPERMFSLSDIKTFCLQYDKCYGRWPESKYEGMSFFYFIYNKVNRSIEYYTDENFLLWEEEMKNVH